MSTTNYLWTSVVGNMLAVVLIPVFASLSDRVGRKPGLMSGALVSGALSFAFLSSVGAGNTETPLPPSSWPC